MADVNGASGKAQIYLTSQAPHAHRTLFAHRRGSARAEHPGDQPRRGRWIRQQGADLPGLRRGHRGFAPARPTGQVGGVSLREPDLHRVRPRLPHARQARARRERQDHRPQGGPRLRPRCLVRRRPDDEDQDGLFHIVTGSYDIPAAHLVGTGAYTNKAAGGVAYRCSFRITEASYMIERLAENAAHEIGMDPAEFRRLNFIKPDQFPYPPPRVWSTTPATTKRRSTCASRRSTTLTYARSRRSPGPGSSSSALGWPASPRRSAPVPPRTTTSPASR